MWLATIPWWAALLILVAALVGFFALWIFLCTKWRKIHCGINALIAFLVIGGIVTVLHLIPASS